MQEAKFCAHTRILRAGTRILRRTVKLAIAVIALSTLACQYLLPQQGLLHSRQLPCRLAARCVGKMTATPVAPAAVLSKRKIQRISLADFEARQSEVTEQLMDAATDLGFFMVDNTGISQGQVSVGQQLLSLADGHVIIQNSPLQMDLLAFSCVLALSCLSTCCRSTPCLLVVLSSSL